MKNKEKSNNTSIHRFDADDANLYGINAAIILYNLKFWSDKNLEKKKNIHEGRIWTYNSIAKFTELFPYMTTRQIRYAIDKLKDENVIIAKSFNKFKSDRTLWYSINDEKYVIDADKPFANSGKPFVNSGKPFVNSGKSHLSTVANAFVNSGKPIPYSKPDNKTDNKKTDNKHTDNKQENLEVVKLSADTSFDDLFSEEQDTRETEKKDSEKLDLSFEALLKKNFGDLFSYYESGIISEELYDKVVSEIKKSF